MPKLNKDKLNKEGISLLQSGAVAKQSLSMLGHWTSPEPQTI